MKITFKQLDLISDKKKYSLSKCFLKMKFLHLFLNVNKYPEQYEISNMSWLVFSECNVQRANEIVLKYLKEFQEYKIDASYFW